MRFYRVRKFYIHIDLEITHVLCEAFSNLYVNFWRVETDVCRHKTIKMKFVLPRHITQRHLKTFIEEYFNAIQVFNHSQLRLYLG